ncbi:MAG: hypothetical protein NT167_11565 [Verrucomicrobia bacterium]|nr:hypothetical protein [Verrucomicrobiota bacterium]
MAKVLFIDDNNAVCENVKDKLKTFHEVITIQKLRWDDACDEAGEILEISEDNAFDVLVLDIRYPTMRDDPQQGDLGGIWLYNKLVKRGLRAKWKYTIIYTGFVPLDWTVTSTGIELAIRVFLNTADIPYGSAVRKEAMDVDDLIAKIAEVV